MSEGLEPELSMSIEF